MTQPARRPASGPLTQWRGYSLLHWLLALAALIFIALWFLSVVATGFSIPDWVPPTGALCLVVALFVL